MQLYLVLMFCQIRIISVTLFDKTTICLTIILVQEAVEQKCHYIPLTEFSHVKIRCTVIVIFDGNSF